MTSDASLPDTAMASGSGAGPAGERLPEDPQPGDDRVLDALAAQGEPVVEAVEDSPMAASAAEADAPLPVGDGGADDDALAPQFQEPHEEP